MTINANTKLKSKIRSGLYGLILGDTIGSRFEFIGSGFVNPLSIDEILDTDNVFGHKGYTDDTIFTLLALEAFNRSKSINHVDLPLHRKTYRRYLESPETAYSPNGRMFDIGNTTRNSLGCELDVTSDYNSGNGVLMRFLPYAAWGYAKFDSFDAESYNQFIESSVQITHGSVRTIKTADVFFRTIKFLLDDNNKECSYNAIKNYCDNNKLTVENASFAGFCDDSLLFCYLTRHSSFETLVQDGIKFGGDVDTNLAIAGQLFGISNPVKTEILWNRYRGKIHKPEIIESLIESFLNNYF